MKSFRKNLLSLSLLLNGLLPTLFSQAPANFDFELSPPAVYSSSNSVSGWTLQSSINSISWGGSACTPNPPITWNAGSPEFSIVSTPIWNSPYIGFLPHSPLGGQNVARIHNTQASYGPMTRLSTQFQVTPQTDLLRFCIAGIWQGNSLCCESVSARIDFYTCSGTPSLIPSLGINLTPNCPGTISTSLTTGVKWTNWQSFTRDLIPYTGQCLKMIVTVADEVHAAFFGSLFFDAQLTGHLNWPNTAIQTTGSGAYVNFCPGFSVATIQGPHNYTSYHWMGPGNLPPGPVVGLQTLTLTAPIIPGSVYTLQASNATSTIQTTYTIQNTTVNVAGYGTTPSCLPGSNGSATVLANGSSAGYTYQWLNSSSLTVSTGSSAANLPAGIYTVLVGASGSSLCGSATQTISIGSKTLNVQNIYKPLCSPIITVCGSSGTAYQWYNFSSPVPGGTNACLAIMSPSNPALYRLTYSNTITGCSDSLNYFLVSTLPGSVTVSQSGTLCAGLPNGLASVTLSPALANTQGPFSYSVISTSSPAVNYSFQSSSLSPTVLTGLYAGVQYSLSANDGNCTYHTTFSLTPFNTAFTLNPVQATLCSGNAQSLSINFTHLPGQYTYSWSPSTFLQNTNTVFNVAQATLAPGSSSTIIYTVVVTPTAINCSTSKTMALTFVQAVGPTLNSIPLLCPGSAPYTLNAAPGGGTFTANFPPFTFSVPVIDPSLLHPGSGYTLNYSLATGQCLAGSTQTFTIGGPSLGISGNTVLCSGHSTTLFASGANSYTWSTGANSSSIHILPNSSAIYTVSGNHSTDNCVSSKTIALQVLQAPNLQVSGNQQICSGSTTTLMAGGASSYSWSNGQNLPMIIVNPNASTVFSVIASGTSNTCLAQAQVAITVNPRPTLFVSGNSYMCLGDENLFTVAGADTYSWSTGAISNSIVISPLQNFTLTVVGTYTLSGCSSTLLIGVDVEECVDLPEIKSEPSLKLYPNPGSGLFFIESAEQTEIEVFNFMGQLVLQKHILAGKHSFDLTEHASGVYFIRFKVEKNTKNVRLIKVD